MDIRAARFSQAVQVFESSRESLEAAGICVGPTPIVRVEDCVVSGPGLFQVGSHRVLISVIGDQRRPKNGQTMSRRNEGLLQDGRIQQSCERMSEPVLILRQRPIRFGIVWALWHGKAADRSNRSTRAGGLP